LGNPQAQHHIVRPGLPGILKPGTPRRQGNRAKESLHDEGCEEVVVPCGGFSLQAHGAFCGGVRGAFNRSLRILLLVGTARRLTIDGDDAGRRSSRDPSGEHCLRRKYHPNDRARACRRERAGTGARIRVSFNQTAQYRRKSPLQRAPRAALCDIDDETKPQFPLQPPPSPSSVVRIRRSPQPWGRTHILGTPLLRDGSCRHST
jgi:hypothetical protein